MPVEETFCYKRCFLLIQISTHSNLYASKQTNLVFFQHVFFFALCILRSSHALIQSPPSPFLLKVFHCMERP